MACRLRRRRRTAAHAPTVDLTTAESRMFNRRKPVRRASRSAGRALGPGCPGAIRSCAQPYRPCSAGPQLFPCSAQGRPALALRGTRWPQRHLARCRPRRPAIGGGRTRLAGANRALRALAGRDRRTGGGRELVCPWVGEARLQRRHPKRPPQRIDSMNRCLEVNAAPVFDRRLARSKRR
jgi:hypothetical protein